MNTKIWGSTYWNVFHTTSIWYPLSNKSRYEIKKFYNNTFPDMIPCTKCKDDYISVVKKYPIDKYTKDTDSLFFWCSKINYIIDSKMSKNMDLSIKQYYMKNIKKYNSMYKMKKKIKYILRI